MYDRLVEINNEREFAGLEKMLSCFELDPLSLFEGDSWTERRVCHLDMGARCVGIASVINTRPEFSVFLEKKTKKRRRVSSGFIPRHIFTTEHAESTELDAVLAWLGHNESRFVFCSVFGDDIARLNLPNVESTFYRSIPGPKSGFWVGIRRLWKVNEGVGEEASTALEVVGRFRLEGDDLDRKWK